MTEPVYVGSCAKCGGYHGGWEPCSHSEPIVQTPAAFVALHRENSHLRALLREWLATPFFATQAEWEVWVSDFGARVRQAVGSDEPASNDTPTVRGDSV